MNTKDFLNEFCPFDSLDIERTIKIINQLNIDLQEYFQFLYEKIEEYNIKLNDIDFVAIWYEYILFKINNTIEFDKNIYSIQEIVDIDSNYIDTQFDIIDEKKLKKLYKNNKNNMYLKFILEEK